ncbi:hypothetical protein [Ochrobactrum chromiisoli]|uniref:Uncharacterized protein n=1 Tax=Ochrobactrum chromiisoli TaxID=2993941 RepID=A0ABT3QP78_9HYPH|nr:hypothetical protein [Ochrobactrum chromiisoli]MCX2697419.1 hypothetical protein [Ochrobactrum chromiisoli]
MTIHKQTACFLVTLALLFGSNVTPGVTQNFDGVKQVLKEGFKPLSLPLQTDWGTISSVRIPPIKTHLTLRQQEFIKRNKVKIEPPADPLDAFGFNNYIMSKDSTQACRYLVELMKYTGCPPLKAAFVNPQNITEFIVVSEEIRSGYISNALVEKTLLPDVLKQLQETANQKSEENGVVTTIALIEPPYFVRPENDPLIAYTMQMVFANGVETTRYYDQSVYVLTRNGYLGINIFNTKFLNKELLLPFIDNFIRVSKPNNYGSASMFDFNKSDIKAEDFLMFE